MHCMLFEWLLMGQTSTQLTNTLYSLCTTTMDDEIDKFTKNAHDETNPLMND